MKKLGISIAVLAALKESGHDAVQFTAGVLFTTCSVNSKELPAPDKYGIVDLVMDVAYKL